MGVRVGHGPEMVSAEETLLRSPPRNCMRNSIFSVYYYVSDSEHDSNAAIHSPRDGWKIALKNLTRHPVCKGFRLLTPTHASRDLTVILTRKVDHQDVEDVLRTDTPYMIAPATYKLHNSAFEIRTSSEYVMVSRHGRLGRPYPKILE